ncbi:uncharacterized protein TNCV_1580581 [Trichonephila clavipes]|nr:uncharacterized protein TNCV_1580581 [Trichonephila clavipes]
MLSIKLSIRSWGILHHSSSNALRSSGREVGGVDGLQFVGHVYPTHALLYLNPVSMLANPYGRYPSIKTFVNNVCTNDIPIDVACHRYTLNMQVSSGTKNNSTPNEPSCTTITVSFNGVLLVVTGTLQESDRKLNLDSSESITEDHCCGVHNACSLLQVNRRRQKYHDGGKRILVRLVWRGGSNDSNMSRMVCEIKEVKKRGKKVKACVSFVKKLKGYEFRQRGRMQFVSLYEDSEL